MNSVCGQTGDDQQKYLRGFLDGVPEGVVLGLSVLHQGARGLGTVAAFFLGNVPEALSSSAGMRRAGRSVRYVFGLWIGIFLMIGPAAAAAALLLSDRSTTVRGTVNAFAAGAILALVSETMIPEAFHGSPQFNGLLLVVRVCSLTGTAGARPLKGSTGTPCVTHSRDYIALSSSLMHRQIIRSKRVVTPSGIRPAAVHFENGEILDVAGWSDISREADLIDVGDSVIMPGLVDSHVHVNEPGRTEWEGYETATRAAAAGGVTTIVDMPLNSIPATTTLDAFEQKLAEASGKCSVDVAFWGGVVPGNVDELEPMVERGVRGFKCFLIHSGVDEFPHVTKRDLQIAMPELVRLNTVLLVHAELEGPVNAAAAMLADHDPCAYNTFLRSRPRAAEDKAVALMIKLCRETRAKVHIVHHSSSDSLDLLRRARAGGLPITVETCPHYLTFTAEEIGDGLTHFKCCPPVRERENREKLWEAVADGTIDMIVSDHSPCTPELKKQETGDFLDAWGGISALQFSLPVMWTNFRSRGFSLTDLTRLMCEAPAKLAGLDDRKGKFAPGFDADIVVWDPDAAFTVDPELVYHRHKLTPYSGREVFGRVESVYVRGRSVYDRGKFVSEPAGELII